MGKQEAATAAVTSDMITVQKKTGYRYRGNSTSGHFPRVEAVISYLKPLKPTETGYLNSLG